MKRSFFVLLALLLCLLAAQISAENADTSPLLPPYTGKLTQEDTFDENTLRMFEQLEGVNYEYRSDRPEWDFPSNTMMVYRIALASGEAIQRCTFEQLTGPGIISSAFSFKRSGGEVYLKSRVISRAPAGDYQILVTAEGTNSYARHLLTCHILPQPEDLDPIRVRPLIILNTLEPVHDILSEALISEPQGIENYYRYFEVLQAKYKYYTTIYREEDRTGKDDAYLLDFEEQGKQILTPLDYGTIRAAVHGALGEDLWQDIKLNILVSQTLTYDDFAVTLASDKTEVTAGQKATLAVTFADPEEVNSKAKNNGVVWSVTLLDGSDASSVCKITQKGVLTAEKKLEAVTDVVVTAASEMVPDKTDSLTLRLVPLTSTLSVQPAETTLYTVEGYNTVSIAASFEPADAAPGLSWTSSAPKVAEVDGNGVVTVLSAGTATITVKATDGSGKSASVKIKAGEPVTAVSIEAKSTEVAPGKSLALKATLTPEKPSDKTVVWSIESADEGLADYLSVSKTGQVSVEKGCPAGTFVVSAEAAGSLPDHPVSAQIEIRVAE